MTLAWNASSNATGYVIYYGTRSNTYTKQLDVGNVTQSPVSGLTDGQTYYFAVKAYGSTGLQSPYSSEVSGTPAPAPITQTGNLGFTGNGSNAVIWQHTNGSLDSWFLNGVTGTRSVPLSPAAVLDPQWLVVGAADFNNDGYPDIVFQHQVTGALSLWYMRGTQLLSSVAFTPSGPSDPSWRVAGVADFNSDGRPDLLLQHRDTGMLVTWYLSGTSLLSSVVLSPSGPLDPAWKVVAVDDLDRNGRPDLVMQHSTTGMIVIWFMNGVQLTRSAMTTPTGPLDPRWEVVAAADVNGDGRKDLIFQHAVTGQVLAWYMSGTTSTTSTMSTFFTPDGWGDPNWRLAALR
jgi:hypothetical protein